MQSITRKRVVLFLWKKDWERMLGMKKQLSDKEKANLWDDLSNYITVNQPIREPFGAY